jgi:hypothetical protein
MVLGVLLVALEVWAVVYIRNVVNRSHYRGRLLIIVIAVGIVLGCLANFAGYWLDERTKVLGVPFMYAIFQDHEDFVGPMTLPCAIGNFFIGLGLPVVALAAIVIRRKRKAQRGVAD